MGATGEDQEIEEDELCITSGNVKSKSTVLAEARHLEEIMAPSNESQPWRLKERMKTVSVALVLCLNIPVDPPDVVKLQPCARLEAWVDPLSMPPAKANEAIGASLQKAYERGQPKARYKIASDPTMDDIKKLCVSLRRNAKEERVLFHYNGHGVPRPTDNGEIWVFNSNYTQYIPLSIYDLQQWMGVPSIYVYDCSYAGKIVRLFKTFSKRREDDGKCIQLASCGEKELLPMNPDLPADLFTSCLTTPVKIAIRYYLLQNKKRLLADLTWDMVDKVPGVLNDRRTMLGELNWIFTAITDTIAWNMLPRDLFQKLFRQDLLVASLFRNFLLAQRIMRSYDCTPVSSPPLPCTYQNHMWDSWDLVLELSLSQLPKMLNMSDSASRYVPSPFFEEQLTAFQVWLSLGSTQRSPPEQLPIVLQVLLSRVYRPRALELLGTFLGLGPWAVNLVLEVGIFPYILRLLQSPAEELRPLLTLLWSKILAVDPQCKGDLVGESGIKYFTDVLKDASMASSYRTMAAFVMCSIVVDCAEKDFKSLKGTVLALCLELILDEHPPLRQWATICASRMWEKRPDARWEATRDNAPEKLQSLLKDSVPEVRAAAAYALGIFIRSLTLKDTSEQGRQINHNIAVSLKDRIAVEASPLVKHELLVALHLVMLLYESSFLQVIKQYYYEVTKTPTGYMQSPSMSSSRASLDFGSRQNESIQHGSSPGLDASIFVSPLMKKTSSMNSLSSPGLFSGSLSYNRLYFSLWEILIQLTNDPYPAISSAATKVHDYLCQKMFASSSEENVSQDLVRRLQRFTTSSASPIKERPGISTPVSSRRSSLHQIISEEEHNYLVPLIFTDFVDWSTKEFMRSNECPNIQNDIAPLSEYYTPSVRQPSTSERRTIGTQRLEEIIFYQKNPGVPCVMKFHPTDMSLVVGDVNRITAWSVEKNPQSNNWNNFNCGSSKISSLAIMNPGSSYTYLAVGCDDGSVRIWKEPFAFPETNEKITGAIPYVRPYPVSAFQSLEETPPSKRVSGKGLLMSWEQKSSTLIVAGDSDKIRLWDMISEQKVADISTAGFATTSLHSFDGEGSWIVAGFMDGYVRLFDRRKRKPIVRQWKDLNSCIITTQLFNSSDDSARIVSAGESGEVRMYDLRKLQSVQVCSPIENQRAHAMAYHNNSHLFALCTSHLRSPRNQQIAINHASGPRLNTIQFADSLVSSRSAHVNCLTFHPAKIVLAVGTAEGCVSVYGVTKR